MSDMDSDDKAFVLILGLFILYLIVMALVESLT